MGQRPRRGGPGGAGVAPAIAGIVIVSLMIAGTIPVTIDDAWLWSLLVLFSVLFMTSAGGAHG
jgi:hypothetical protein